MTDSNIGPTEVSFEVRGVHEYATLRANTFREAMRERDALREQLVHLGAAYETRLNDWHALRAENEDYASQITTLEWKLSEATKAAELAQAQYHHSTLGRVAMQTKIDALRAENERLRAALAEIQDLELEGDASLADAMAIADEALHPPPASQS